MVKVLGVRLGVGCGGPRLLQLALAWSATKFGSFVPAVFGASGVAPYYLRTEAGQTKKRERGFVS